MEGQDEVEADAFDAVMGEGQGDAKMMMVVWGHVLHEAFSCIFSRSAPFICNLYILSLGLLDIST